jgi:hypothetical protein
MTPEYFLRVAGLAALLLTSGCTSTPDPERLIAPTPLPIRSNCQTSRSEALVDGVVAIRPGETLCVQLQPNGDSITAAALTDRGGHDVLIVKLLNGKGGTTLYVQNPMGTSLCYAVLVKLPGKSNTLSARVGSPLSHNTAVEGWAQPIEEVRLSKFRRVVGQRDPAHGEMPVDCN